MFKSVPGLTEIMFLLAAWAPASGLGAASIAVEVQSDGLEQRLLDDAADGRLDEFSLFDASLVASGVDSEAGLAMFRSQWEELVAGAGCMALAGVSEQELAGEILRELHQRVLTRPYQAGCTELQRTLNEGHFNCVTATVLYRVWAASLGLQVTAVGNATHVYCRLETAVPVEIQTTAALGFSSGRAAATAAKSAKTRPLTDVQLVAKIYYNRGVAQLQQRQFRTAWKLLQAAYALDPHDDATRHNRLSCLNNWALAEAETGRYPAAAELLALGLELAPEFGPYRDNDLHVHQRWVSELCRDGKYAEALAVLESGHRRRPEAPLFNAGRAAVCQIWRQAQLAAGPNAETGILAP